MAFSLLPMFALTACGNSTNVLPWGGKKKENAEGSESFINAMGKLDKLNNIGGSLKTWGNASINESYEYIALDESAEKESGNSIETNIDINVSSATLDFAAKNLQTTDPNEFEARLDAKANVGFDISGKYDGQEVAPVVDKYKNLYVGAYLGNNRTYLDLSSKDFSLLALRFFSFSHDRMDSYLPFGQKVYMEGIDQEFPVVDSDSNTLKEFGEKLVEILEFEQTVIDDEGIDYTLLTTYKYNNYKFGYKFNINREISLLTNFIDGDFDSFDLTITAVVDHDQLTKVGATVKASAFDVTDYEYTSDTYEERKITNYEFEINLLASLKYDNNVKVKAPKDLTSYGYFDKDFYDGIEL